MTIPSKLLTVAAVFIVAAGLHLGHELFVPLVFSVLLALILSPLVDLGQRLRLPRVVSVITVTVLVFAALAGAGYVIALQGAALAKKLPEYKTTAQTKLDALRVPLARTLGQVQEAVRGIQESAPRSPERRQEPLPVRLVEDGPNPLKLAGVLLGPLFSAGAAFAVVFLLVVFFLVYKDEIRDRFIRLVGDARVHLTNQTITEATHGVSRFLFWQACVNASFGVALGLGLWALGVPNPILWGFFAAVLRFIPYLGPVVAGLLPVAMAFAAFPGWTRTLMVLSMILVLELVMNNFVEPLTYGKRTGLSPLAVVVAAFFWTWMWGGIGLILAVPLTVCLLSLGKYVPSLRFLAVLLGDEPPLEPKVHVYHRLVSGHQEEAAEFLEGELASGKSLAEVYDETLIGVLRMAEVDLQQGRLDDEKAGILFGTLLEIVDDLAETARGGRPPGPSAEPPIRILCLPSSDKGDEVAARMLCRLLQLQGLAARTIAADLMAGETMESIRSERPDLLAICTSPPSNLLRARYLYKRLRRQFGEIPIVEGLWGDGDPRAIEDRVAPDHKARIVSSFREAEKTLAEMARELAARKKLGEGAA